MCVWLEVGGWIARNSDDGIDVDCTAICKHHRFRANRAVSETARRCDRESSALLHGWFLKRGIVLFDLAASDPKGFSIGSLIDGVEDMARTVKQKYGGECNPFIRLKDLLDREHSRQGSLSELKQIREGG